MSLPTKFKHWKKLPASFYERDDVVLIAKELIGKLLVTNLQEHFTAGRIVETEAYEGETDKACHASKGRTGRTEVMFGAGGHAYIYLCYGIHQMFNIVTSGKGTPHAILIRAVEPVAGIDVMLERTGKRNQDYTLTRGPGNVGKAFGFHTSQTGMPVTGNEMFVADDGFLINQHDIIASPRIGVDYAGAHAEWHYRFYLKNNNYVSGPKLKST